ncbi:tumor necrosis factor receptor type 1-associated DEATH domain protein [Pleurodeles waltl]|uniref:tumor necrosis factor receptor type 1-associated DEATH domain protein n=1 Tax=Pleurodeles waltl TaxID=8319 RepID=UPI0037095D63
MLSSLSLSERPQMLISRGDTQFSNSKMDSSFPAWVGSAFLFVESTSQKIDLSNLYMNSKQKLQVFKALKLALSESAGGGVNSICILKIYCNDNQLIMHLKFCSQEVCRSFLQRYRDGLVQQALQDQLQVILSLVEVPIQMELKVGSENLHEILDDEQRCLQYINQEKPDRLPDEEIAELEDSFRALTCQHEKSTESSQNNSLPPLTMRSLSADNSTHPKPTFIFQDEEFVDRPLTSEDHQKFSKLVGKKWKQVARSLQKTCRALRDPAIENLSFEHEKEGLYEQAYQMILKFIQSEGKKATLQRLVSALQDTGLTSLAEELLGIHQNENGSP